MNKIKEFLKKTIKKFKAMGKLARICVIISLIAVVIGIVLFIFFSFSNKYQVLFTDLESKDAKLVTEKLEELKVDMKIEGNTILVPKEQVDKLRLEIAPSLNGGSVGYELMDEASSFGITSEEFHIKKLRMTQGELEKTIKSFPQVNNARVHITIPEETVFMKEQEEGSAAAYIELKTGENLEVSQVKSIVSLISSSVSNIPRENVEVIDQNMKLLSDGLFTDEGENIVSSGEAVSNQRKLEQDYEKALQKSVYELLNPVLGTNKIKTQINVDLDFDSKQKTEIIVDPNKVIKNQTTIKEASGSGGTVSTAPVDDNMSNNIADGENNGSNIRNEQNTEYEIGKTETKTISAPGEVKRVTASVVIDGNLDNKTTEAIKELVGTAIGYKQARGDQISVVSMNFDSTQKEEAEKQITAMNKEAKKKKFLTIIVASVVVALILVIIISILLFRNKRKDKKEELVDKENILNVAVDDNSIESFNPIDFHIKDEKNHVEDEVKKYAIEKPNQVADVIKSWLNENER
ncbi:flagellar basal-body MS-ring/collar protein FliF [Clostridium mediterraneense]|uniref:flagellar basal-body MS-ring/collar protein FliF n=1 Tax=Clostridium mediterraneense TaxID=1805472 RepID=UPI0008296F6C|nr:flagellar basal-body MS-ring/collar protein FliF [Clostridium mediterraneense]